MPSTRDFIMEVALAVRAAAAAKKNEGETSTIELILLFKNVVVLNGRKYSEE
jgi:hypothetical protein